jgi:hypothetical protein
VKRPVHIATCCSCLLFSLVVVADNATLDALTRQQHFEARRASSSNENLKKNGDARSIPAGESLVLMDEDGPGIITHFWNTVGAKDIFYGRSLVLRIYYDGAEKPCVQAPLGDFFGVGHGAYANYTSAVATVSSHGRSRTCYWRIPFNEHIKVTVTNDHPTEKVDSFYYYLDWQKHDSLPEDTTYFHAEYRQQTPASEGNYTMLETEGRGHYVGTVHSAQQVELGWYGEGDDFFYIDGADHPQLRGTGTEDYFNDAWGFREFSTPYHGVSLYEGVFPGDRVTAYRWHIADPIPFTKSLKVDIEHRGSVFTDQVQHLGQFFERPDWVSSVAFWYQYPTKAIEEAMPPLEKRIPPYKVIELKDLDYRADPSMLIVPDGGGITYIPNRAGARLDVDFEVEEDGRYRLDGVFFKSIMSGIYQPLMDGEAFGPPIDFTIINADNVWQNLDLHDLKAGKHTLSFQGVDQVSPVSRKLTSKMRALGFSRLILLRLEDMEGYQQLLKEETAK